MFCGLSSQNDTHWGSILPSGGDNESQGLPSLAVPPSLVTIVLTGMRTALHKRLCLICWARAVIVRVLGQGSHYLKVNKCDFSLILSCIRSPAYTRHRVYTPRPWSLEWKPDTKQKSLRQMTPLFRGSRERTIWQHSGGRELFPARVRKVFPEKVVFTSLLYNLTSLSSGCSGWGSSRATGSCCHTKPQVRPSEPGT